MIELLVLYLIFCIATSSVYYIFIFLPVSKEVSVKIDYKIAIFLAGIFIAPKIFLGMLVLKDVEIRGALLRAMQEAQKSDLD